MSYNLINFYHSKQDCIFLPNIIEESEISQSNILHPKCVYQNLCVFISCWFENGLSNIKFYIVFFRFRFKIRFSRKRLTYMLNRNYPILLNISVIITNSNYAVNHITIMIVLYYSVAPCGCSLSQDFNKVHSYHSKLLIYNYCEISLWIK